MKIDKVKRSKDISLEVHMRKILAGFLMVVMLTGAAVAAGAYDIREMTPAITSALEARKARFAELKALKAQGMIGENNRGYVEVLSGGATSMDMAEKENKDRKFIYQEIVKQNELGKDALATVESVFAAVQREKASVGEKIQEESGAWVTKQ